MGSLERLVTEPPPQRVLRVERTDLPDDFGPASRVDLSELRSGLAELAALLQLEPLHHSRAQEAMALLSMAIVQTGGLWSEYVALPWGGRYAGYQERGGVRVPLEAEVFWIVEGREQPYYRGRNVAIEYTETPEPYLRRGRGSGL